VNWKAGHCELPIRDSYARPAETEHANYPCRRFDSCSAPYWRTQQFHKSFLLNLKRRRKFGRLDCCINIKKLVCVWIFNCFVFVNFFNKSRTVVVSIGVGDRCERLTSKLKTWVFKLGVLLRYWFCRVFEWFGTVLGGGGALRTRALRSQPLPKIITLVCLFGF
jgi:hypothetical protein